MDFQVIQKCIRKWVKLKLFVIQGSQNLILESNTIDLY